MKIRLVDPIWTNAVATNEEFPMPDDLKKIAPQDPKRVNVNQAHEVEYWCAHVGCTETELRAAVKTVGDSVVKVRKYLDSD